MEFCENNKEIELRGEPMITLNDVCEDIKVRDGKSVIESCEKNNGYPTFVMFSHDMGVRLAYIGVPAKEVLKYYDKVENMIAEADVDSPLIVSIGTDRLYSDICKRLLETDYKDFEWIAFDCGHSGETFDEQSIRAYYPEEADKIINDNLWRGTEAYKVVRNLNYCNHYLKLIADTFSEVKSERNRETIEK